LRKRSHLGGMKRAFGLRITRKSGDCPAEEMEVVERESPKVAGGW